MRSAVRLLAAASVVVGIGGAALRPSAAQSSTFTLRARADVAGVQFIARDAPAVSIGGGEIAFVTPASAQSELDSLGGSRSFASAPYPGDLVVSLPATVSGVLGGTEFPVPGFPFYVSSSHPTEPSAAEEVGPYRIAAESSDAASSAEARVGVATTAPQVLSISSTTSVGRDAASGAAFAVATTEVAPFAVGGTVQIGRVTSEARVDYDPTTGNAARSSSLTVASLDIAGVEVAISEAGLVLAGAPLLPIDVSALVDLLAGLGIQLEYLPAVETEFSVVSAGLRVTYEETFPSLGLTTVRLVLGQVSAAADPGSAIGGFGPAPAVPVVPVTAAPAGTGTLGTTRAPVGSAGGAAPADGGPTGPTAAPATAAATPIATATRATLSGPLVDLRSFYPILAAGGAIGLLSSQGGALQRLGRRVAGLEAAKEGG